MIDVENTGFGDLLALPDADVCIVGSGPAGSTLARELSGSRLRVVVLESGAAGRRQWADQLNAVHDVGRPRQPDQWSVRNRVLGGSSYTWGGRCTPFDEIDFAQRSWVPGSGWPIGPADLAPFLERSAAHLGLTIGSGYNTPAFVEVLRAAPELARVDPAVLLPTFWQFSLDSAPTYPNEYTRFGRHLAGSLADNVTVVTGATVVEVVPTPSGRGVRSVVVRSPSGARAEIRATTVVLAAGGIENARLLLASDSVQQDGLGNEHDQVGRYLMDHPRGVVGRFAIAGTEQLQQKIGRYVLDRHQFRAGFRLSPELQEQEHLLNVAAWLGESVAEDDPWAVLRRVASRSTVAGDLGALARNLPLLASGLHLRGGIGAGARRKLDALTLVAMVEQVPDASSRVTLDDQRDRFGSRLPRIDWRAHPDEARSVRAIAAAIADQLGHVGLPVPVLEPWVEGGGELPLDWLDVAHPTGTTRMSDDPRLGVVDRDLQVHGVDGLFVAGSSSFPTAGHGNPTQMIVATAVRLADHLRLRASRSAVDLDDQGAEITDPSAAGRGTVVLTGARGRIGRIVLDDLVKRGYGVRAVSSTPQQSAGRVEWCALDLEHAEAPDFDRLVRGATAVVHLAAELGRQSRMEAVNVRATRLLAEAAERAGIRSFVYTSTVSVYGSGRRKRVTESSPVLSVDRDRPEEYLALPYVREYGRTKLRGEHALRAVAARAHYVLLRPAVVVGVPDLIGIRDWPRSKRLFGAHRHSHHVYVRDVSDSLIWAMERGLSDGRADGVVEVFNVAEDDSPQPTHAAFMRRALRRSGDPRFRTVAAPGVVDLLHDWLRFRRVGLGRPLWAMRFRADAIERAGWVRPFGMRYAERMALARLGDERAGARLDAQSAEGV